MKKQRYVIWLLIAAFIVMAAGCDSNTAAPSPSLTETAKETLKVYFLNVGKGDSALVSIPGGYWVMIDTGPKDGFREIGRQLMQNGVGELSAVFLTHGHSDHIGGLENLLSIVECEAVYTNGDGMKEKKAQDAAQKTQITQLKTSDVINIGEAAFTVIGPIGSYTDENDNSLVIMLEYNDVKLLFTADQLFDAERDLLELGGKLDADVLKVAHHGQDDTSSLEFIKAVSPLYAVITTDLENSPSQQVVNSVSIAGGQTFSLGETGTMVFETDGKQSNMSPLPAPAEEPPDVRVDAFDISAEYVTIANHSENNIDLTGWCIYSDKGKEAYFFPKGTELAPGENISVYSGDAAAAQQGGLIWTTDKVWSKKDTCLLFDSWGREVLGN